MESAGASFMAPLFDALMRVAELVHENLPCVESIGGYARVDNVRNKTVEQLRQLHKAGCGNFYFGNESGDDAILDRMNKGYNAHVVVEMLSRLDEAGMPYIMNFLGALCALLDRAFYAAANFGQLLAGRPAAAIATCWRAGATPSIDRINKYFTFSQMPVVSSEYWNGYLGAHDRFGTGVLKTLAKNMADLLRKEQR